MTLGSWVRPGIGTAKGTQRCLVQGMRSNWNILRNLFWFLEYKSISSRTFLGAMMWMIWREDGWALSKFEDSLGLRCHLVVDPRFRVWAIELNYSFALSGDNPVWLPKAAVSQMRLAVLAGVYSPERLYSRTHMLYPILASTYDQANPCLHSFSCFMLSST